MKSIASIKLHRGATEDEVRDMRRELKIKLPTNYVEFLKQCGWADLNGDIIYGLGPDASDAENVIVVTDFESVSAKPAMSSWLIPLMADGAGNHDCLDTRKIEGDDCPVVFWDHEDAKGELQRPKTIGKTFLSWLDGRVKEAGSFD